MSNDTFTNTLFINNEKQEESIEKIRSKPEEFPIKPELNLINADMCDSSEYCTKER